MHAPEPEGCEVLVQPRRDADDPELGPDVLMVMVGPVLRAVVRESGAEEVRFSDRALYRLYLTPPVDSKRVGLAGPFLGAPHAVLGMEKLIALGARRFWVFGWCGSIDPALRIGDLFLPDWACAEEGTSAHYPGPWSEPRSAPDMTSRLAAAFTGARLACQRGGVWTTDAPYRETREKVQGYQGRGVLGVEMEFSALLAVAAFRGVSAAGVLAASDELFGERWRRGFSDPRLKRQSHDALRCLLKTALTAP